jgi:glycosyltransferase involved in cell wall biosynthesis
VRWAEVSRACAVVSTMTGVDLAPYGRGERASLAGRTILQIIPHIDAGGAERTTIDVAAALVAAGARALVASEGGRLTSELQAVGGLLIPFPASSKNPFAMLLNARRLARLVIAERVDIVHVRSRAPAWVALMARRIAHFPLVTTFHGAYAGRSGLKLRYSSVMARGDLVIANSDYTAASIARLYPWARAKLRVIHRGTDFAKYAPGAVEPARVARLRKAWEVAPDERIVLIAARLSAWKGQKVLIEAARLLNARGLQGVRYIMAGDAQGRGGYVRELDAEIDKGGLQGVVSRVGHCTDMPAAFLAASVVAVPSTEPEAFGRTAVEAQAMGTPVVVSDLGAVPETVLGPPESSPEGRTGWRVPAGDAQALAEALQAALGLGASAREAMARRARAHVEARFSLDRMTRETLEAYAAVLGA